MKLTDDIKQAIHALREKRMIILVDNEDRENEGDLVLAAQYITPSAMNFMIKHARGLVCLSLTQERLRKLNLPLMVPASKNKAHHNTAFTVSIEAAYGVSTGISAADRARTVQAAVAEDASSSDIVSPGHIFPLKAAPGGLKERRGHTEGSLDALKLAGLRPAAVICEILNDDGTMARMPQLEDFSKIYDIPILRIDVLERWVKEHGTDPLDIDETSSLSQKDKSREAMPILAHSLLPNHYGGKDFKVFAFEDARGNDYLALVKGEAGKNKIPVVRLHSECLTGDALGSLRCDCGAQLHKSLEIIGQSDYGVLVYIQGHEGRGIGLINKIKAYSLQDQGYDTVDSNHKLGFPTDKRDWDSAAAVLRRLKIYEFDLLTNNPAKVEEMEKRGLIIRKRIGLQTSPTRFNQNYLETKRARMGHFINSKNDKTNQDETSH